MDGMNSGVIVAAGRGARMGSDKLFLQVAGLPLVAHSWKRLEESPMVDEVILVVSPQRRSAYQELAGRIGARKPWRLVEGGELRRDSVWNGLEATCPEAGLVAVHDGARPCLTRETLERTFRAAARTGAAAAAAPVSSTLKRADSEGRIEGSVDRSGLWAVETPQIVRRPILRKALEAAIEAGEAVTDEASACALIGQEVVVVGGGGPNPKVTYPADLPFVEWILSRQ